MSEIDLVAQLNAASTTDPQIVVRSASTAHNNGQLVLRVQLNVSRQPDADDQEWELDLPLDEDMLDPDVKEQAFVATYRALIDEWRHVKDAEPGVARQGRRLF